MLRKIKKNKNYKFIVGLIVGGIIFGGLGVYGATVIAASKVSFTSKSGLTSTNVQDALDEAYQNATGKIIAYTYNQTSGASNYCVTGEESTCVKTNCYKTKTAGSCRSGTIIKYKVNDNTRVVFHVIWDDGNTITMQSQKNTVYNIEWNSDGDKTKGPITALTALEQATAGWSNVNQITYAAGTTTLRGNRDPYTGCSSPTVCTQNPYTLPSRTARARMITVQEAVADGCLGGTNTCPVWMNNYLAFSASYSGVDDKNTANGASTNNGYWTMSASSTDSNLAYCVYYTGAVAIGGPGTTPAPGVKSYGVRAVVEINK